MSGAKFLDQVGDELEARARNLLGNNGLQIIRLLSVMTAVGINGVVARELRTICDIFGAVTPNDVLSNINPLTRSGLIRRVGNYLEVVPPCLQTGPRRWPWLVERGNLARCFQHCLRKAVLACYAASSSCLERQLRFLLQSFFSMGNSGILGPLWRTFSSCVCSHLPLRWRRRTC